MYMYNMYVIQSQQAAHTYCSVLQHVAACCSVLQRVIGSAQTIQRVFSNFDV